MAADSLLFENVAGSLGLDAGFLKMRWTPSARTLTDTQALLGALARELARHGLHKVLTNQQQMRQLSAEEQHWVTNTWLPQAVTTSGYRFGAVVVAADLYARLATASITSLAHGLPLRYRSFDDEAQAVEWLRRQE